MSETGKVAPTTLNGKRLLFLFLVSGAVTFFTLKYVLGRRYELLFSQGRIQLVNRWTGEYFRPVADSWTPE